MAFEDLPGSWVVWNDEPGDRAVLAYRPDVFDSQAFPAPCMPTLYVTRGPRSKRPPRRRGRVGDDWHVTLYLEPDVNLPARSYGTRPGAVEGAVELARAFDAGDVDYRGAYQVPREDYLDELDALTGREA
jgi:hypothetical protein